MSDLTPQEAALLELVRCAQLILVLRRKAERTGVLDAVYREEMTFRILVGRYAELVTMEDLMSCPTIKYMFDTTKIKE